MKYTTARENAACGQAKLMENLLILLVVGYLLLAPIALIIAIVALSNARRGEARVQDLEAENSRLEVRLQGLARKQAAPGDEGEEEGPESREVEPEPEAIPAPAAAMDAPRPPSISVPPCPMYHRFPRSNVLNT